MEPYDYRTQRLYVTDDLIAGKIIEAHRSHANYLLNVLRMKDDASILVFNGRHGEWLGKIAVKKRKACDIILRSQVRTQTPPYDLVYLFAPLKKGRLEYMVQKAVEMGVGTLQPVITAHTQVKKINTERMRANVIEAAEQCGILSLAQVKEPVDLDHLLDGWDRENPIIYADEAAQAPTSLNALGEFRGKKLALLVGPEGGFSPQERLRLRSSDFVYAISLGPRILRADTAGVAALAVLQANAGDWRQ